MKGKADLVLVDDPILESVAAATDEDPRIVTPTDDTGTRVKVSREIGTCDRCGAEEIQTIIAYDPAVYEGAVCATCVLAGKATESHGIDSEIMRPMVFVARALSGEEPYRTLLKAADEQRENPDRTDTVEAVEKARRKEESREAHRLRKLGLVKSRAPRNRREKRVAAKQTRKRNAKVAKTAKVAKIKAGRKATAQVEDFDAFASTWE